MHLLRKRLPITLYLIILSLSSCVTGSGNTTLEHDPQIQWRLYGANMATLARITSGTIPDLSSRVYALIRSAEAADYQEIPALAVSTLARAQTLIQRVGTPILRAELYSALARAYLTIDQPTEALTILTRGVDLAIQEFQLHIEPDSRTIQILEDLIYTLFALGPEGFDQLRRAVQRVYLIPDYGQRVLLLTQIAAQYQTQGVGQRANLLLQQAIAALDAIPIPELRIRGYAAVARRFYSQRDFSESKMYADIALEIIQTLDIESTSPDQIENLQQAVIYLIEMDYTSEAPEILFRFPSTAARQTLLSTLAQQYFLSGQPFAAELILQQLVQQVSEFYGTTSYVYGILRVVEQYREADDLLSAEFYLQRLIGVILNPNELFFLDDVSLSEVLGSALRLGLQTESAQVLQAIQDPYLALIALDRVVPYLFDNDYVELLYWVLEQEERLVSEFPEHIDDGQARLALGFSRVGDGLRAMEALDTITSPYTLSITASEMAFYLPPTAQDELVLIIERFIYKYQPPTPSQWSVNRQ